MAEGTGREANAADIALHSSKSEQLMIALDDVWIILEKSAHRNRVLHGFAHLEGCYLSRFFSHADCADVGP